MHLVLFEPPMGSCTIVARVHPDQVPYTDTNFFCAPTSMLDGLGLETLVHETHSLQECPQSGVGYAELGLNPTNDTTNTWIYLL